MKHLLTLILLITLFSCKEDKQPIVSPVKNVRDTLRANDELMHGEYEPGILNVKDKSLYSKEFLESLEESEYPKDITVVDNYVITGGDTITFPDMLELNKQYIFKGKKENKDYELNVKRISLCDIVYSYAVKEGERVISTQEKYEAYMPSTFFLYDEKYTNDKNGSEFTVVPYLSKKYANVYIGIGYKKEGNNLLAVLVVEEEPLFSEDITLRHHIE